MQVAIQAAKVTVIVLTDADAGPPSGPTWDRHADIDMVDQLLRQ